MKRYTNIIWDWNGTLLDDIDLCVEIANKIVKNHGIDHLSKERYREVFGFPITSYYERIGVDMEKESFEILTEKFINDYLANVRNCSLQEDAGGILREFHGNGVTQFILTAAHKKNVEELLDHHKINLFFAGVEGLDNHRAESKEARGFQLINRFGMDRNKTVLIGDTIHDYEVAEQIGVDCILIANGHQSRDRLVGKMNEENRVLNNLSGLMQKKL